MGVRINTNIGNTQANLFCSTSDWAFGPIFSSNRDTGQGAEERAEDFLVWLKEEADWSRFEKAAHFGHRDPRELSDGGLQHAYSEWLLIADERYRRTQESDVVADAVL